MNYKDEWLNGLAEISGYNKAMCEHTLFLLNEIRVDNIHIVLERIREHVEEQKFKTDLKFKQTINQ